MISKKEFEPSEPVENFEVVFLLYSGDKLIKMLPPPKASHGS